MRHAYRIKQVATAGGGVSDGGMFTALAHTCDVRALPGCGCGVNTLQQQLNMFAVSTGL